MKYKAKILSTFGENGPGSFGPGISQFQNEADVKTKMDAIADQFLDTFKPFLSQILGVLLVLYASKCVN